MARRTRETSSRRAVADEAEAAVGDRDAVGVAAQVLEHALGAAEGSLRVDHPLGAAQGGERCGGVGLSRILIGRTSVWRSAMSAATIDSDLVVIGGGSAGCALVNRACRDARGTRAMRLAS